MTTRAYNRVVFHWSSALWALSILIYILQFWWVGWGLRNIEVWTFLDFIVLVFGSIFIYGAAEMALSVPEDNQMDMLLESQHLGRLSALSMLFYFLVGPYVNIVMYRSPALPSLIVPSAGVVLMILVISLPGHFKIWSLLFAAYSLLILFLTV